VKVNQREAVSKLAITTLASLQRPTRSTWMANAVVTDMKELLER